MTVNAPNLPPVVEIIDATVPPHQSPECRLIERINWRVCRGDYWVVGALPGSGKTDLLATSAGLQRPRSGSHLLFGRDPSKLDEDELLAERLRIGLVFENGGRLFGHLTVAENIALPLRYHRDHSDDELAQDVAAILDMTGLTEEAERLPTQISRAWRQRAGLARALALQPEVLLLDNPLATLDGRHARWWFSFLARLNAGHEFMNGRPVTLIVTTEDLRTWINHGRQFAMVKNNCWLLLGDRDESVADPGWLLREWRELVEDEAQD